MKQIDNLKENDILALPILSHGEAVLIHADVVLTHELIERVRNLGTKTVYIKDEEEGVTGEICIEIRIEICGDLHRDDDLGSSPVLECDGGIVGRL